MEIPDSFEQTSHNSVVRHAISSFIAGLQFVRHQLVVSDQSPHEGRLRGSIMPSEYVELPDHFPVHDDTM